MSFLLIVTTDENSFLTLSMIIITMISGRIFGLTCTHTQTLHLIFPFYPPVKIIYIQIRSPVKNYPQLSKRIY